MYTGSGNRDISFGGRDMRLDSLAAAQNTVIDCQGRGRAFVMNANQTPESLIAGSCLEPSMSSGLRHLCGSSMTGLCQQSTA